MAEQPAALKKVVVGSRLPYGLILEHPAKPEVKVTIRGLNSSPVIVSHVTTDVDGEFWADWIKANEKFGPVASGAIFAEKTAASVDAIAKENRKRKTGLEQLQQDGKDERAGGIKSADTKDE